MPSSFGSALRVTIFGQSHSPAIGCIIEGLPSGHHINLEALAQHMMRRSPGQARWSTPRKEADAVSILSGLNPAGNTSGAPLALVIQNTNTRPSDYEELKRVPRPSHADWTAQQKWHGEQDVSGGGHFSGRLTAPLCAAGGIAMQLLSERDICIAAHLSECAGVTDEAFLARGSIADAEALAAQMHTLKDGRKFPVLSDQAAEEMQARIEETRKACDSVGGIVECVATGLPAGIGSPMFDGIESTIARIVFGIPAVKGLEFGAGFATARMLGSEHNDPYVIVDGKVYPAKNDAGGNLGGITSGAPLLWRMAVKPTSSIAQEQHSVDLIRNEETVLRVHGRHDPCIAPRAVPVAESACALAILDSWLAWPPCGADDEHYF